MSSSQVQPCDDMSDVENGAIEAESKQEDALEIEAGVRVARQSVRRFCYQAATRRLRMLLQPTLKWYKKKWKRTAGGILSFRMFQERFSVQDMPSSQAQPCDDDMSDVEEVAIQASAGDCGSKSLQFSLIESCSLNRIKCVMCQKPKNACLKPPSCESAFVCKSAAVCQSTAVCKSASV